MEFRKTVLATPAQTNRLLFRALLRFLSSADGTSIDGTEISSIRVYTRICPR